MKIYQVYELSTVKDKWGADSTEEVLKNTAEVSITYSSATSIMNDVRYQEVTHVGLTRNKDLKKGQILVLGDERYVIHLEPNNSTRLTQLFLKKVVA